jgi:hypothetical protein
MSCEKKSSEHEAGAALTASPQLNKHGVDILEAGNPHL